MSDTRTLESRIWDVKATLGDRLVILGHHYQRDEVIQFADFRGDSLGLSQQAASVERARYIVFCGVHFMAETAAILARPGQQVFSPDPSAGCFLADAASLDDVAGAWALLDEALGEAVQEVTPVTYVNSSAQLKAFCGERGGIVCTSSNAKAILEWSFRRRKKVLFFPDQHLGRWTGYKMGIPLEQMVVWDFDQELGGLTPEQIRDAKMILWKGHCSVHQMFQPQHVERWRAAHPKGFVISHPECASRSARPATSSAPRRPTSIPSPRRRPTRSGWWAPS